MTLGEKIFRLRTEKGMSQEALAEILDVSRQSVSKWETEQSMPEPDKITQLAEYFHVSCDYLLKEYAEKPHEKNEAPILISVKCHYEYKSKKTIHDVPLVHINIGSGFYKAHGIIAVGNIARGIISAGIISTGILSFGVLSLGLISLGCLVLGIIACGAVSVGAFSVGAVAIGYLACGGCAVGIYAIGGCAVASRVAMGDYAHAKIAIGNTVKGGFAFSPWSEAANLSDSIENTIMEQFPKIPHWILRLFC